MKKIRMGVIGCGRIAQAHFQAIKNLEDEIQLVAVSDVDAQKALQAKEKFRAKQFFQNYAEVLQHPEIDAVILALPNHLHHAVSLAAARAGKHILLEKPMALNLKEAQEMVREARQNRITFMVGQSRRFGDAIFALQKNLSGMGTLFRIIISFLVHFPAPPTDWWKRSEEAGGLVILLQGSHSLDSILTWMGKMPVQVYAHTARRNPQWEGEDEADILLTFDQGETASVHLSLSTSPALHEAILVGTKGVMRLEEYTTGKPFGFGYHLHFNGQKIISGDQNPSNYTLQLLEFVRAIREKRTPVASGEEVLRTQQVLDAARQSGREKRPVIIPPLQKPGA